MPDKLPPGYQENRWEPLLRRYWDLTMNSYSSLNGLVTGSGLVIAIMLLAVGISSQAPAMWVPGIAVAILAIGHICLIAGGFRARDRLSNAWINHHQKNILSLTFQMVGIEKSLADAMAGIDVVANPAVELDDAGRDGWAGRELG